MTVVAAPASPDQSIPSFSHPVTTETILGRLNGHDMRGRRILDLGAGAGYLSWKLDEYLAGKGCRGKDIITACDLYPEQFQYEPLECIGADFRTGLPFDDGTFDIVICMEVIEHVPDQQRLINEMVRVARPGGRVLVTTPNVLNANSRVRYLFSGTMPLFDILPIEQHDVVHSTGHIGPIPLYYMYYFARLAGCREVDFHIDRIKKSAVFLSALLYPFVQATVAIQNLRRKKRSWWSENTAVLQAMNRWSTLVGRTIIMEATK